MELASSVIQIGRGRFHMLSSLIGGTHPDHMPNKWGKRGIFITSRGLFACSEVC
jgi:hypothetical protein